MLRFLFTRVSLVVPTFIGITLLVFVLVRLIPGDPIETMAGERGIDPARARAAAARIRLRPAGHRAIRLLSAAPAARRPRPLDRHAEAGDRGIRQRCFRRRSSCRVCAMLFALCIGLPGRHHRRGAAQFDLRPRRDGALAHRLFDADLLVGSAADPAVFGAARLDAGVRPHRRPLLRRADDRLSADRHAARRRQGRVPLGAVASRSCRRSCSAPCRSP